MNDMIRLNTDEITTLRGFAKSNAEEAYVNIGLNQPGQNIVQVFTENNYKTLLNIFFNIKEFNNNVDGEKILINATQVFETLNSKNASINLKLGKLLSCYLLAKSRNFIADWSFYRVPIEYRNMNSYNLLSSGNTTPTIIPSRVQSPSPVFIPIIQKQVYDISNKPRTNMRTNRKTNYNDNDKNQTTFQPKKPIIEVSFSKLASDINTFEASKPTGLNVFKPRVYNNDKYIAEKSELISIIKKAFETKPIFKVICDNNGILSIQRLTEDEDFDTTNFCYCPIHTGNNFGKIDPISEELRNKISGVFGFLTSDSKCFDYCYLSGYTDINDQETKEIKNQKNNINSILTTFEKSITELNNLNNEYNELKNNRFVAIQNQQVAKGNFTADLGNKADRNFQNLQIFKTNPLFIKTITKNFGKIKGVTESYMDLPFMDYTFMSTYFGRKDEIISEFENISICITISVPISVTISVPIEISKQILNKIPSLKDKTITLLVKISHIKDYIYLKITDLEIGFKIIGTDYNNVLQLFDDNNELNVNGILKPIYANNTYRSAIYNLGVIFARNNNIYDLLMNNEHSDGSGINILMLIGSWYISKYSDYLIYFIMPEDIPEENQSNISIKIVNSKVNKISIQINLINELKKSIKNKLEENKDSNNYIKVDIDDNYTIDLTKQSVIYLSKYLDSIPLIDENTLNLNGYHIKIDEISDFLTTLEKNLSELSILGKKDILENTKFMTDKHLEQSNITSDKKVVLKKVNNNNNNNNDNFNNLMYNTKLFNDKIRYNDKIDNFNNVIYNTKFFNDKIRYNDKIEMTGFEAMKIIKEYIALRTIDLSEGSIEININSIPLTSGNIFYLADKLFDSNFFTTLYNEEQEQIVPRSYILLYILLGNYDINIELADKKQINLKYELEILNPYNCKSELPLTIDRSDISNGKVLQKYMKYMEQIDIIALKSLDNAISKYGCDLFNNIFTYGSVPISFSNKTVILEHTNLLYNNQLILRNKYNEIIKPFFETIHMQDTLVNDISSYYLTVGQYTVFSVLDNYINNTKLVVPSNPLYSTSKSDLNEELFNEVLFTDFNMLEEDMTESIKTIIVDNSFKTNMDILFPGYDTVNLINIIPNFETILKRNKYYNELSILSIILKFKDYISTIFRKIDPLLKNDINKTMTTVEKLFNYIIMDKLAPNKSIEGLPSYNDLTNFINNLVNSLYNNLSFEINQIRPVDLLKFMFDNFTNILSLFNNRRKTMINFSIKLTSNFYDYRLVNGVVTTNMRYENFSMMNTNINPDKVDIISESIKNCDIITDLLSNSRYNLDLSDRYFIFNKFYTLLNNCNNITIYENIKKSIYYFLYINNGIDKTYINNNYSIIINTIAPGTINKFKEIQSNFISGLDLLNENKDNNINTINTLLTIDKKIKLIENTLRTKKNDLISNFVEYVGVIDIIVKSYDIKKQSYGNENFEFRNLIDNIKLRVDTIKLQFSMINDIEMRIILAIFLNNQQLYNIRKSVFKELGNRSEALYSIIDGAIDHIKYIIKLSKSKQIDNLNGYLTHGITIKSSQYEVDNIIRKLPPNEQDTLKKEYVKCRFISKILDLINEEVYNIKNKLFDSKIQHIILIRNDERPKFDNFGSELNIGFDSINIDNYTKNEIITLGKNITRFIDRINNSLTVIDSGPGMHLLSDMIESFIKFINGKISFDDFYETSSQFFNFNTQIRKSIQDIINSLDFKSFVSIINGKFDEFSDIISSISYFNKIDNVFTVYELITHEIVSGFLLSFHQIFTERVQVNIESILSIFSKNCNKDFNIEQLLNILNDFNQCIINFIDEYVDENHNVLTPSQVLEMRNIYNLKTLSPFMKPLFMKLNKCIHITVNNYNKEFISKILDKYIMYISSFSNKFKSLKILESYMIRK
jgi:predicted transposase YbfD/YdcC